MRVLSYDVLEGRVSAYVKDTDDPKPGPLERWSFALGLLAAGVGALCGTLVDGLIGLRAVQAGLALEIVGLGISSICMIRREWRTFHRPHVQFSNELERDYGKYRELVSWLLDYPKDEVARRLRFLRDRKASMIYRFGIYSGGMERLGFLPLLIVLYIQFKDWEFGDWQVLGRVHLVGALLLWVLFLAYLGAWWLVRLKSRVDTYEMLLAEALATRDEAGQTSNQDMQQSPIIAKA